MLKIEFIRFFVFHEISSGVNNSRRFYWPEVMAITHSKEHSDALMITF